MDPAKVTAVLDWEPRKTVTEIHSFLGLAGYYRKFIQDFSKISASITHLTKKVYSSYGAWSARKPLIF